MIVFMVINIVLLIYLHVLNPQYAFKPHLWISEVIFLLIYEVYQNMNI